MTHRNAWCIATLLFLAPVVSEVLSGTTRLSSIFVLIPEIMVWGCGTLMIREAVRRRHLGWQAMLLLSLALSLAEEFIIQQTSLAPIPWISPDHWYGRFYGVNWIWLFGMLSFTAIWVVFIPIHLTELIFPENRERPWLGTRGWIISCIAFLIGARIAWYGWTQIASPRIFHVPIYQPPRLTTLAGAVVIALLILLALNLPRRSQNQKAHSPVSPPWLAAFAALVLSSGSWLLVALSYGVWLRLPFSAAVACAAIWAILSAALLSRWAGSPDWTEMHTLAVCSGAMLTCMGLGFWGSSSWPRADLIGKITLNLLALVLLLLLSRKITGRNTARA